MFDCGGRESKDIFRVGRRNSVIVEVGEWEINIRIKIFMSVSLFIE